MLLKKVFIAELKPGQHLDDYFVISEARLSQSRNGPYWHLVLQDRSGLLPAKIWHPLSGEFEKLQPEQLVQVRGQVGKFREQLQLIIQGLDVVEPAMDDVDWEVFVPGTLRPAEELFAELENLCLGNLSFSGWKKLCRLLFKDREIRKRLLFARAAKSIHHAYLGGLLEHTLGVVKLCLAISDCYPGLDRDILIVGALVHDLGKAWELEGRIAPDYTDAGRLLGHILLGLEILDPFLRKVKELSPELILHLKHMLASHHGELDFGSPKRPKTSEALVLHFADNLDAKLKTFAEALAPLEGEGSGWSSYQSVLERYLYRPAASPQQEKGRTKGQGDRWLSLLKE